MCFIIATATHPVKEVTERAMQQSWPEKSDVDYLQNSVCVHIGNSYCRKYYVQNIILSNALISCTNKKYNL